MAELVLRILVSRLRFVGDIVLTVPVLEVLRDKFPDSEICYLGDKDGVSLLENNPDINEILPYDFARPSVVEQFRVASALRGRKFDVAIDLFGNPRSAIVVLLSGAKMRIGGEFGWRAKAYTHPIKVRERVSAVTFHLRYLRPLGIEEEYRRPRIFLTETEVNDAVEYLASAGIDNSRPRFGMHIGATWPAKVWLPEHFSRLAQMAADELGAQIIVTYGPRDLQYLKAFSSSCNVEFVSIPPQQLRRLAAVISVCDSYVSNDAAPMHISAAVGTPTIGIFGPGEPDIWFPYSKDLGYFSLKKDVQCCRRDFCSLKGGDYMRCMKQLKPEEVFEVVKEVSKKKKREMQ